MSHTREDVISAAQRVFPGKLVTDVLELLDAYGVESYERERERVQVAIVTLSEGDEAKLRYLIGIAKKDYRDVLFWADCPEQAKLDTPEKRRVFRELVEKLGVEPPDALKE
jgi:superfamily I DNA/RNA helicase